ncbi:MAG: YciI family protein, partial [Candidatus Omnitrophica bacterium]|nr:YciI family protein [Candidatus Omnitrophota bacterium]
MKYMLLIYGDEKAWTVEEREQCMEDSTQICHQLNEQGKYLGSSPLQPVS